MQRTLNLADWTQCLKYVRFLLENVANYAYVETVLPAVSLAQVFVNTLLSESFRKRKALQKLLLHKTKPLHTYRLQTLRKLKVFV